MTDSIPAAIAKIAPDGNLTPRQKRRLLIEMSLRKQKPGSGSADVFLQKRTAMNPWPDLRDILHDIPWVVVDGVATRAYMPERMTKDLDILVHQSDGERSVKRLQDASYNVVSELAVGGYLLQSPAGVEIDVLFGDQPWLADALAHPQRDPADYPVLSLPYLLLMKLEAMRAQDWADVSRMLGWAEDKTLDQVRAMVKKYSPQDSEDLESLIFIGKQERE